MLVFALILVCGYMGYSMLVGGVRASYDLCLEMAQEELVAASGESCGSKREIAEELVSCIEVVKKETNLKAYLYSPMGYKSKVTTLVETHNEQCPNSLVKPPGEGIYLEY